MAFYTFTSRKMRSREFYLYYFLWLALQLTVSFFLATLVLPAGVREKIWLGHPAEMIVLSLLASFGMNQLWLAVNQAGESIRATVTVQAYNVALSAAYLFAVLVMIRLGAVSVGSMFVLVTLFLPRGLAGILPAGERK